MPFMAALQRKVCQYILSTLSCGSESDCVPLRSGTKKNRLWLISQRPERTVDFSLRQIMQCWPTNNYLGRKFGQICNILFGSFIMREKFNELPLANCSRRKCFSFAKVESRPKKKETNLEESMPWLLGLVKPFLEISPQHYTESKYIVSLRGW